VVKRAALFALLIGCAQRLPDRLFLVEAPTVLAIRADPAEAAPGTSMAGAPERDAPREGTVSGPDFGSASAPAASAAGPAPLPETPMPAPERENRETAPPREYHAEPREPGLSHEPAPMAHFEAAPKPPEADERSSKPYVVWSSAPTEKSGRGPEE
jgi:hypothetical protein